MPDTINDSLVGSHGDDLVIGRPPAPGAMLPREKALRLAAWIVAIADPGESDFREVLAAIMET